MKDPRPNLIQFNLPGFVIFSVMLVATGAALAFGAQRLSAAKVQAASSGRPSTTTQAALEASELKQTLIGPWGELIVREIEIERPQEYIALDEDPRPETWTFSGFTPEQVRDLLQNSRLD